MFNVGTGELAFIFVLALIVLGPDKLPEAARKAGYYLAEFRKLSGGFQQEFRDAMDLGGMNSPSPSAEARANQGTGNFSLPAIDAETKPADTTPADTKPADTTPGDTKPVSTGGPQPIDASTPVSNDATDTSRSGSSPAPDVIPPTTGTVEVDGPSGSFN